MRSFVFTCLVAILFSAPWNTGGAQAQNAKKDAKPKVLVGFDAKRNETTVSLEMFELGETPSHSMDQRSLTTSFAFPGDVIKTPKVVIISVLSSNSSGYLFDKQPNLAFVIDGERLELGELKVLNHRQYFAGRWHVSAEQVYQYIPYEDFLRVANGNKVKIDLAGKQYSLSGKYLKDLRAFADLMLQEGTKPV